MDQNQDRRRGHFHRGRRGPDRRGPDRRLPPPPPAQPQGRDHVDVEQIMREIRARIAQRQGIDLSNQQIQDLAARKLESILDPRAMKPSLLDGLRRSLGTASPASPPRPPSEPVYTFEDTTIYDSHRGMLRFIRKLLNPLLKLFFNPNPLIRALHLQARLNVEAAEREAERERRQTEWNALHYEIVQRMVTEVSRVSLEVQSLSQQLESLSTKVDFSDRRVRSIEAAAVTARPLARQPEVAAVVPAEAAPAGDAGGEGAGPESAQRRRRRRRGRRSPGVTGEAAQAGSGYTPDSGEPDAAPEPGATGPEGGAGSSDVPPDEPPMPAAAPAADLAIQTWSSEAAPGEPVAPAGEPAPPAPQHDTGSDDPNTT
ncbi:MAG: hypothetical protein A3F70_11770 [Acidobacteria bacterium RIFCSPLOWO2_12_FULL_67_14]|nr:MAG: hypothetical protein A3H29_06455 [Acidobacteria bacterium RIFCSPLOWO2_02_FULL_67_21]OFW36591.1 MAG: hypothetical protein A3F70_11770 [Acidobacteria bacterium RIFCSPLOWO2_12_FULL_67_14]